LRAFVLIAAPMLFLLAACGDSSVSPSSGESPSPLAVVSATAVATVAPATGVPVAVAPQDPHAAATAAGASAVCADGTWSFSQNRSGTCSHHGGVHWWTGNLGPAGPGAH
jgi:Protein of unknown function (DUF3761)